MTGHAEHGADRATLADRPRHAAVAELVALAVKADLLAQQVSQLAGQVGQLQTNAMPKTGP